MVFVQTPLIESTFFDSPHKVLLKLENTQPSGSFKSRGLSTLVALKSAENPSAHFYTSSGGNAGIAVAEAAFALGCPTTICVPLPTPKKAIEKMERWNARVILHGSMWSEADAHIRELIEEDPNAVYCHPFDNPIIWDGHASMIDELKSQLPDSKPGAIALSCGGGGLFIGVMTGLIRQKWEDVPVYVVETEGANSFHQSIEAGKQVVTSAPTSVARTLGSTWVPEKAIEYAKAYNVKSILVSDKQAVDATKRFAYDHNFIVEPACGATLATVYDKMIEPKGDDPIVVIVCGGSLYGASECCQNCNNP